MSESSNTKRTAEREGKRGITEKRVLWIEGKCNGKKKEIEKELECLVAAPVVVP
jgi:hypothetical protein